MPFSELRALLPLIVLPLKTPTRNRSTPAEVDRALFSVWSLSMVLEIRLAATCPMKKTKTASSDKPGVGQSAISVIAVAKCYRHSDLVDPCHQNDYMQLFLFSGINFLMVTFTITFFDP